MKRIIDFIIIVLSILLIAVGANAQTSASQIITQLQQQPTANTSKAIIKKKLDLIKKGLKIEPNNPELLYQKALIFTDIERYQLALNIVNKLLEKDSANAKYLKLQVVLKKQLNKAKQTNTELTTSLNKNPKDVQTRLDLINSEITLHNYKKALALTKKGLKLHPNNKDLLSQQKLIYIDMGEQPKKVVQYVKLVPLKKPAPLVMIDRPGGTSEIAVPAPEKNFITIESYPTHVDDLNQTWFYNYLSYGRKTNFATFMLGVDHIYRDGDNGYRYRAEVYPKVNKYLYFHFAYGYANTVLFPKHYVLARAHVLLPSQYQLTFGGRYYKIIDENLWAYSIWLSRFFGNNWFAIRPTIYASDSTKTVVYVTGIYRYYFAKPNHYLSLSAGTGETPDLLDLDATGFEIIHAWHLFASYQVPLARTFFLILGGGYTKEKYPKNLIRRKWSGLLGLKLLF